MQLRAIEPATGLNWDETSATLGAARRVRQVDVGAFASRRPDADDFPGFAVDLYLVTLLHVS